MFEPWAWVRDEIEYGSYIVAGLYTLTFPLLVAFWVVGRVVGLVLPEGNRA